MTNSGYNSSRLGFRGTEDLGGGMAASFWLEGQIDTDSGNGRSGGALDFQRRSTVSLSGRSWGELRIGRDYTPQFWNLTVFDPFGTNGVGTTQTLNSIITGPTAVRASNSIGYLLPAKLGGHTIAAHTLTHAHPDHIGSLDALAAEIARVRRQHRPKLVQFPDGFLFGTAEAAWQDHWGYAPMPFDEFCYYHIGSHPTFDPALWHLAFDGDQLAGVALCRSERAAVCRSDICPRCRSSCAMGHLLSGNRS